MWLLVLQSFESNAGFWNWFFFQFMGILGARHVAMTKSWVQMTFLEILRIGILDCSVHEDSYFQLSTSLIVTWLNQFHMSQCVTLVMYWQPLQKSVSIVHFSFIFVNFRIDVTQLFVDEQLFHACQNKDGTLLFLLVYSTFACVKCAFRYVGCSMWHKKHICVFWHRFVHNG